MMFDAVDSDALGLTWEPSHQIEQLIDIYAQLETWGSRIVHVHGKDGKIDKELSVNTARGSDNIIVITDFREWVIQTGKESCYN